MHGLRASGAFSAVRHGPRTGQRRRDDAKPQDTGTGGNRLRSRERRFESCWGRIEKTSESTVWARENLP